MDTRKLHRGKRKDTLEWVEGFYAEFCIGVSTVPFIGAPNSVGTMLWFEVYPETVGSCIGMTDIHGKNIFEGDVVRHYNQPDAPELFSTGLLFWDDHTLRFMRTTDICPPKSVSVAAYCRYEVIGNIHDDYDPQQGRG